MKIFNTASETNGITSEDAVAAIGNRYDLVLVGARRVRELNNGSMPKVASKHSPIVTAMLEIEAGKVTRDYLYRSQDFAQRRKKI
jgi:DNA-directed RNA polymerase subunit omega